MCLLLLSPAFLVIAVAIHAHDRGPVFFRQKRVGKDGHTFWLWKFRTMVVDAEERLSQLDKLNEATGVLFKMRRDPRITKAGGWLRRWSLDELPQLINVVIGDMALVGPRPASPGEVAAYNDVAIRRLLVKPGLTGLWQISGRSDLPWEESMAMDLEYVDRCSARLDAAILARTVTAVLRGSGAY